MQKMWFGSDYHFGHTAILDHTRRGNVWPNIQTHDEQIIQSHNAKVAESDEVYLLGDIGLYRSKWRNAEAIEALNGRKHLVIGNHDRDFVDLYAKTGLFASIALMSEVKWNKVKVVMCHTPSAHWHMAEKGTWMLHGHFHNDFNYEKHGLLNYRIMDVGLDALADLRMTDWEGTSVEDQQGPWGIYRPVEFDTIKQYFEKTGRVSMPNRHGKVD